MALMKHVKNRKVYKQHVAARTKAMSNKMKSSTTQIIPNAIVFLSKRLFKSMKRIASKKGMIN